MTEPAPDSGTGTERPSEWPGIDGTPAATGCGAHSQTVSENCLPKRPFLNPRFVFAMVVYAAIGTAASFRLDGRPRVVVWLVLGLFVVRTVLVVLKQRLD
jgi:hypothetical protein